MLEERIREPDDDFVQFHAAGAQAKGRYRCADCGYGVTIHDELPTCPMCTGTFWEPSAWTPFGAALRRSLL